MGENCTDAITGTCASMPGETPARGDVVYSSVGFPLASSRITLTGIVAASSMSLSLVETV